MRLLKTLSLLLITVLVFNSCKREKSATYCITDQKVSSPFVLLFSVQNDKDLGIQVKNEIAANPTQFPVLNPTQYASSYTYLNKMKNKILNSGQVALKDKFDWELFIIKDDATLNAFCTPGGYIYVYTGLIKYLDSEDQLAGVLGHEIAHADRRHSSKSLQTQYGVDILLNVILGKDSTTLKQIAGGLYSLKNSREHESEADEYSVRYLCPTDYQADGAADFFEKLIKDGNDCTSAFFSTHPCPDNRVQAIHDHKSPCCTGNQTYTAEYAAFKASLP